jgi:DNA modification methylase
MPEVKCAHDEMLPLERLVPNPRNPNKHPKTQIALLARIIEAQGWRAPITVSTRSGFIVRGHGRYLAAGALGCETAPVDFQDYANEAEEWADLIADNRLSELAETDEGLLRDLLAEINASEFDPSLTGYDEDQLMRLLMNPGGNPGLTDEDEVPEVQKTAVTRPGDIWLLDRHRVMCGDATNPEDIAKLMGGEKAYMVFTDPPYNVDYEGKTQERLRIQNDKLGNEFEEFLLQACMNMLSFCDGAVYVCMASAELHTLRKAFVEAGGHWSTFLIWAKNTFTLGRSDYQRQYEPILYGWKEGGKHFWCGDRDQGDMWFFDKPRVNDLHPTMKPVALVKKAIANSSRRGEVVLDPFGGSGSALIACESTSRIARLMELDPLYCDVIVRRWQEYTGRSALLAETGRHDQPPNQYLRTTSQRF